MLISQGMSFEELGLSPGGFERSTAEPRAIWQVFCEHFSIFDGTPSGLWIENSLAMVFGIEEKPNAHNADALFTTIQTALSSERYSPHALFERFNIDVLCTTDLAEGGLEPHRELQVNGWVRRIRPTFRADNLVHIGVPGWRDHLAALSQVTHQEIGDYRSYLQALEVRRADFRSLGAVASDLSAQTAFTCRLAEREVEGIFQRALNGTASPGDNLRFSGHMVCELARMSAEDGLVMQFHVGAYRNHSQAVFRAYGPDNGFDMPTQVEWTHNLKPLLDAFGMDRRLQLILFTLDESGYARELAPLAGAYPAVKLGPPWWFFDSPNGMMRYFEAVMETAGFDNTVGFNDDARSFVSIPARHDLWRRMAALWLAKLVHQGQLSRADGHRRMADLAYHLGKKGYRLG
jgi:glucuronate isomerase